MQQQHQRREDKALSLKAEGFVLFKLPLFGYQLMMDIFRAVTH